jgi:putative heme transporter
LHPVVVAVAVLSGTVLAGILGAVVAVPLVAVVWTVFSTLRGDRPVPVPAASGDGPDPPSAVALEEDDAAGQLPDDASGARLAQD